MEHDVFISYSRKDEELVKKIRAALTQANISYWIDKEEIKRGTSYAKAISQAVYNSKILLFIWSEHSNNSENTANEISLALEFEKNIVPFKISKKLGPSDMTYHLLKLDRIDACPFESNHIQELVASIAQCLGRGLTPSSPNLDIYPYCLTGFFTHFIFAEKSIAKNNQRYGKVSSKKDSY